MATFGMSAKDRLAMFENKAGGDTKKPGAPPKKKIGKLSVPGQKEKTDNGIPKKASDLKKVPKKTTVKDKKQEEVPPTPKNDKVKNDQKPSAGQVEEKKPEANKAEIQEQPQKVVEKAKTVEQEPTKQPEKPVAPKEEAPKPLEKTEEKAPPKSEEKPKLTKQEAEKPTKEPKEESKKAIEKPAEIEPPKVEEKTKPAVKVPEKEAEKPPATKEQPPPEKTTKKEPPQTQESPKSLEKQPDKQVEKPKQPAENPAQKESPKVEKKPEPVEKATEKKVEKPVAAKEEPVKPTAKVVPKADEKTKVDKTNEAEKVKPSKTKEEPKNPEQPKKDSKISEDKVTPTPEQGQQKDVSEPRKKQEETINPDAAKGPKIRPLQNRMPLYKAIPEEFYDTLFYFSGMGTVVGSAMNQGVFVPNRATKTALDSNVIEDVEAEKEKEREHDTYLIRTARKQAFSLAEELRKLQGLLGGMPCFGRDKEIPAKRPAPEATYQQTYQISIQKPKTPPPPPPPKTEKPWPPPIQAPLPKPQPSQQESQWPPPQESPVTVDTNVGVFKANVDGRGSQPWQQKYGSQGVENTRAPEPFNAGGGNIPSGLKPWELSRLRGLEVKGYHFTHEQPGSGADHSDAFYHGHTSVDTGETAEDVASLAPFLVSSKSKKIDRQHILETSRDPSQYHPRLMTMAEYYGEDTDSLPYHDL